MQKRVVLQPAFILHSRPFRETSAIVNLLTQDFGHVVGVLKGAKSKSTTSKNKCHLQMFRALCISWTSSHHDLVTLYQPEGQGVFYNLTGKSLLCGFYLNELCYRLLPAQDACPDIYHAYQVVLDKLQQSRSLETDLRYFEWQFLKALGYAVDGYRTWDTQQPIESKKIYILEHCRGFREYSDTFFRYDKGHELFHGDTLLNLVTYQLHTSRQKQEAKHLMRLLLQFRLGDKPLKSRCLF